MTEVPSTPADAHRGLSLTTGEIRNLSARDVSLIMRETDDPDMLYLLSLRREEMNR